VCQGPLRRGYAAEDGSLLYSEHHGGDLSFLKQKTLTAYASMENSNVIRAPATGISTAAATVLSLIELLEATKLGSAEAPGLKEIGATGLAQLLLGTDAEAARKALEALNTKGKPKVFKKQEMRDAVVALRDFVTKRKAALFRDTALAVVAASRLYAGAAALLELAIAIADPAEWAAKVPDEASWDKALAQWKEDPSNVPKLCAFLQAAFGEKDETAKAFIPGKNSASSIFGTGAQQPDDQEEEDNEEDDDDEAMGTVAGGTKRSKVGGRGSAAKKTKFALPEVDDEDDEADDQQGGDGQNADEEERESLMAKDAAALVAWDFDKIAEAADTVKAWSANIGNRHKGPNVEKLKKFFSDMPSVFKTLTGIRDIEKAVQPAERLRKAQAEAVLEELNKHFERLNATAAQQRMALAGAQGLEGDAAAEATVLATEWQLGHVQEVLAQLYGWKSKINDSTEGPSAKKLLELCAALPDAIKNHKKVQELMAKFKEDEPFDPKKVRAAIHSLLSLAERVEAAYEGGGGTGSTGGKA
jgi:hypothetical protein